mmetsp:Transcript_14743/g.48201  ORF Transcript_14743/g.48201 Transcript_14743/m.48201 type:complete len:235 (+) Transcript_14743:228-932(+)
MSGCPVVHTSDGNGATSAATQPATAEARSGCPLAGKRGGPSTETVNPANAMPAPNQQPAPGQRLPLSKERVESTIPQATAQGNWVYPSPQMFYNAMKRKGFEPQEEEMRTVVAIHNTVNERTWREILTWEKEYPECLNGLKLVRFGGRPDEPTAKARFYGAMGYKPPFDRHDWVVERCGKEVRYLIDYYNAKPSAGKPVAMYLDVRPAGDDAQSVWERLRMPFLRMWRAGRSVD